MPSSDGVRHIRGAVFSMDQLIIGDAFRLCSTPRGVTSTYAGFHQTNWFSVFNLAENRHPLAVTTSCPTSTAGDCDRLATRRTQPSASPRRTIKDPPSETPRITTTTRPTSRALANGKTITHGEIQAHAGPSVARQRIKHRNHPRVFHQACTRQHQGIGNQGATTKGAKREGRSYFRDSKFVWARIRVPRVVSVWRRDGIGLDELFAG